RPAAIDYGDHHLSQRTDEAHLHPRHLDFGLLMRASGVPTLSRNHGFTLVELLIGTTILLLVTGAALTTFTTGLTVNDSAAQLGDANQNLRAGTNQLIRDLMQAGRIIGPDGIPMPTGAGASPFNRPGPVNGLTFNLVVDDDTTLNLPSITTGYQLGPTINGS